MLREEYNQHSTLTAFNNTFTCKSSQQSGNGCVADII